MGIGNNGTKRPDLWRGGFTLIEIMIALAILAVLFTLVYGAFDATHRISEQMEEEADYYRLARLGFYHLARDLSMVHPPRAGETTGGLGQTPLIFKGEDRLRSEGAIEFPNDSIQFTSVSHGRTMRDVPESDQAVVSYYLQGETLIYEALLSNGSVAHHELGEHLQGLNFRYLDPTDRTWVDQWDAEEKRKPPLAVEVELVLKNSRGGTRHFRTSVEIPLGGRS